MGRHHTAIVARLREAGLRVTAPRVAVLEELERNRSHPNPIEVHRLLRARHPSLSLSTVYLTVETFANAGLLRRMAARDGRLRVDGVVDEHDHAVCRRCGDVFDKISAYRHRTYEFVDDASAISAPHQLTPTNMHSSKREKPS